MERAEVDHYGATYEKFSAQVYGEIRTRAFGEDIGQTGWLTADEHDILLSWLELDHDSRLLDVACGSGGPSLRAARLTHCRVHGIDIHEDAVRAALRQAEQAGLTGQAEFEQVDASGPLPFPDATFDALVCVDAINHLPDRARTVREWARVVKPGGRIVFTDPIVVTGPLSSAEIAVRSSIGFFLFVPEGFDEEVLLDAGCELVEKEDRTENMARIARQWRAAREERSGELRRLEGDETFEGQQRFFEIAGCLAAERRLSRYAFSTRRRGGAT